MQPLTFWLAVVAFILLLGVSILEWSRPRKTKTMAPAPASPATAPVTSTDWMPQLHARLSALEQKSVMMHERIQRIENILTKIPLDKLEQQLDSIELSKKVERLIEFKNEARIQLAALEERMLEQKNKPLAEEQQLDSLERELKEQDKSLRELETMIPVRSANRKKRKK